MNKTIILIGHKKRQGKDTFAGNLGFPTLTFATPMKEIVAATFGITTAQLEYAKNNGRVKSFFKFWRLIFLLVDFRLVLQKFGNDIMKSHFGWSVWGERMVRRIQGSTDPVITIPDFRFEDELRVLSAYFGRQNIRTVKVTRPGTVAGDQHESEVALDNFEFDHVIENDGSLWDLHRKAILLRKEIF